ncbi:hypothetical protein D4764_03G0005350 [Takifugu flavidus]|uniref:Integrase catalytic domain-containing protein n=1 Tax=Takifugu flavidus TaxID=433684 RepID=A0A5C6NDE3_9TELE|nr:hypothetical protein D4764_03G0005350 [Takifugu flavidus]
MRGQQSGCSDDVKEMLLLLLNYFDEKEESILFHGPQFTSRVWKAFCSALGASSQRQANHHHVPVLSYLPGHRVWLSSKDLTLQVESRKLSPHFVGPFVIDHIINPYLVPTCPTRINDLHFTHLTFSPRCAQSSRFSLMYHPSSRNAKPDALSHLFSPDPSRSEPSFILSPFCILGTGSWQEQRRFLEVQRTTPDPFLRNIVSDQGPQFTSRVWKAFCNTLGASSQRQANHHHVPVPSYLPGQRVWLSSKDLTLLTPHFVGPFVIDHIVNPYLVHLNLPPSLKIHPTFLTSCPRSPRAPHSEKRSALHAPHLFTTLCTVIMGRRGQLPPRSPPPTQRRLRFVAPPFSAVPREPSIPKRRSGEAGRVYISCEFFHPVSRSGCIQWMENGVLRDMLNQFVFVHINDIFSETRKEHVQHVRLVLQRLLEDPVYLRSHSVTRIPALFKKPLPPDHQRLLVSSVLW